MTLVHFRGKWLNIIVIQVYAQPLMQKLTGTMKMSRPSRTNTKKKIIGDWNAKVGSQRIPGMTGKFDLGIQNKTGQRLTEFCQETHGHSKHLLPITWEMTLHMNITIWSIPKSDWLFSLQPKMEKLYTVNKNKTWSWLWLRAWTPNCKIQA